MAGGAIRAGKAFIELFVDQTKAIAGLENFKSKMASFGNSLNAAMAHPAVAAARATADAIKDAVNQFVEHGSKLADTSNATGVAGSALSELEHAASQTGTSLEDLEKALVKMNKTVGDAKDGNKQAIEALKALGVSVEDLEGMSPDQMFERFADGVASIADQSQKTSRAMDVFGRSATNVFGMLNEGADGIARLRQEARDLHLGWSDEDVRTADELGDKMATFHALLQRIKETIGASFGRELVDTFDKLNTVLAKINANMDKIIPLMEKLWWLNKQISAFKILDLLPGGGAPDIAPKKNLGPLADAVEDGVKASQTSVIGGFNPAELSMQAWGKPLEKGIAAVKAAVDRGAQLVVQAIERNAADAGWQIGA
jgi:ABC-type transporter Mla subunit MlaD